MEITINTISEYIDIICKIINSLNMSLLGSYERLLFRGQSNIEYQLLPSIARGRQCSVDITIFDHERNLIEMAKYKMPDIFRNDLLPIELLALLQHHGIPTRLLDITENALVALFFACWDNDKNQNINEDGEIIIFKIEEYDIANYPIINAIADSYRFAIGTWSNLNTFYSDVIQQPYLPNNYK